MAYTTIDDPSAYFHTQLFTGTGSELSVTNDANAGDFKPDWIWIKQRNASTDHGMWDSNRGVTKNIKTNKQDAESTEAQSVKTFNTDGFTLGTSGDYNGSSDTHVAWQWVANGGTTSSNSDGDITSTVQANTTAGFSIVTYTGNGSSNQTVAHGLGATPDFLLWKNYDTGTSGWDWKTWHTGLTGTNYVRINKTAAQNSSNGDMDALPSSTLFTVGNNGSTNGQSGQNHTIICYAFTSIQGYSKFGSYMGTGNADGPFVYTGFKPAWVMMKRTDNTSSWNILDNKRDTFNVMDTQLLADGTEADQDYDWMDALSNGFKIRRNSTQNNADGGTYIYMAFAESPFVSSEGVPTTAR